MVDRAHTIPSSVLDEHESSLAVPEEKDRAVTRVPSKTKRFPIFDNIKGFLICNVVMYHFGMLFTQPIPYRFVNGYFAYLMLVVMPGFVFIAGALSKHEVRQNAIATAKLPK